MTAQLIAGGYTSGMQRSIEWKCAPVSAEIISLLRVQHGSGRGQLWERLAEFEVAYDLRNYRQRWSIGETL